MKPACATVSQCLQPLAIHFDVLGRVNGGIASPLRVSSPVGFGTGATDVLGGSYWLSEVNEPGTLVNQFFPAAAASQNANVSGITPNIFVGYYQEQVDHSLVYNVAKSNDLGATFGVNPVTTSMPLPTAPLSQSYCTVFGFPNTVAGAAACNSTPYFGTYTGAAADSAANGAYFAWTDTRPNTRNFNVGGSQDTFAVHVN